MAKKQQYVPFDWSSRGNNTTSSKRGRKNDGKGSAPIQPPTEAKRVLSRPSKQSQNDIGGEASGCANPHHQSAVSFPTTTNAGQGHLPLARINVDRDNAYACAVQDHAAVTPGLQENEEIFKSIDSFSLAPRRSLVPRAVDYAFLIPARRANYDVLDPYQQSTRRLRWQELPDQLSEKTSERRALRKPPLPGKVYFLPDGDHIPTSIIHSQKQQRGFFCHPVLVVAIEGNYVYFYALTKERPQAIKELNMALRLGNSNEPTDSEALRLAPGSHKMKYDSWVNLEQRFFVEWTNLDYWAVDVVIDQPEFGRIARRVTELEADQNRYIYKPLLRVMCTMQPGMVIMLPNKKGASTLGAPVLIVENNYPYFRFLRVKRVKDNFHFSALGKRNTMCHHPTQCLTISKVPEQRIDGTPVMLLEPDSPEMREMSYVEVDVERKYQRLDDCKTWCWPPVTMSQASMSILHTYIDLLAAIPPEHRHPPTYLPNELTSCETQQQQGGPVQQTQPMAAYNQSRTHGYVASANWPSSTASPTHGPTASDSYGVVYHASSSAYSPTPPDA